MKNILNEEWRMKNEEWELLFFSEEWKVKSEKWRVKSEEWKVKSEKWRVKNRADAVLGLLAINKTTKQQDDQTTLYIHTSNGFRI